MEKDTNIFMYTIHIFRIIYKKYLNWIKTNKKKKYIQNFNLKYFFFNNKKKKKIPKNIKRN